MKTWCMRLLATENSTRNCQKSCQMDRLKKKKREIKWTGIKIGKKKNEIKKNIYGELKTNLEKMKETWRIFSRIQLRKKTNDFNNNNWKNDNEKKQELKKW